VKRWWNIGARRVCFLMCSAKMPLFIADLSAFRYTAYDMSGGKSCVVGASGWLPLSTRELSVAMSPTVGHPPWTRCIMAPNRGSVLNRCCPVNSIKQFTQSCHIGKLVS